MSRKNKADSILEAIYDRLSLITDDDKYQNIYPIIEELQKRNNEEKIPGSTTGTITERLVEIGLKLAAQDSYFRIGDKNFKWVGDFALFGVPFNVIISVKSFSAKERLLVSGSGSALAPTIGYGWFKSSSEFSNVSRLDSYKQRGFTSIYMPENTYERVSKDAQLYKNINEELFLRKIENFVTDIGNVLEKKLIGQRCLSVANVRKL